MNCKQDELAVIVMCPRGAEHLRGRIIRLTTRAPDAEQLKSRLPLDIRACWYYEPPLLHLAGGIEVERVNDCTLRPIRDPGSDVKDAHDILVPEHLRSKEMA